MTTAFDIIGSNKALQDHWLRRIAALIIDGVIIYIFVFVVGLFLIFWPFWGWVWWLLWGVIALFYFILFEMMMKSTPGKKLLSLEVVGTDKELDFTASLLRNISKVIPFFLLIDWLIGMFTDGDPRQKMMDRYANTTVQRTDKDAYLETQFRQMAYVPPHPTYQPPQTQQYQSYQPPPQPQQPAQQQPAQSYGWPHQEEQKPVSDWPQHDPGAAPQQQQQVQQPPPGGAPRFCQNCGNALSPGPDGRLTCAKCGAVY